jgi:hypothetical protein
MLLAFMTFYDRQGRALAWFDDEQEKPAIYRYSGMPGGAEANKKP